MFDLGSNDLSLHTACAHIIYRIVDNDRKCMAIGPVGSRYFKYGEDILVLALALNYITIALLPARPITTSTYLV